VQFYELQSGADMQNAAALANAILICIRPVFWTGFNFRL